MWPTPPSPTTKAAWTSQDLMILAAAERVGATPLYTFDRKLARIEDAALLGV